jgi:hypothetical protein
MARHLGDLNHEEVYSLTNHIADWLQDHDVAGSIAHDYSLYDAVQEEHEKARLACNSRRES